MNLDHFLESQLQQAKTLRKHGFNQWPDLVTLARYTMELSDRVDAIARYLNINPEKDYRGRWVVHSGKNGANNG